MTHQNSTLSAAIDNAIHLIGLAIQDQEEARKGLVKGPDGKQEKGKQAPK